LIQLAQHKIQKRALVNKMTLKSLAVTLLTTTFNITKLYMVLTLRLCVLYRSQDKTAFVPYMILRD